MWRRWQRRRWLEDWEPLVAARLRHWAVLDDAERDRLGSLIEWMVRSKHWEAARGFTLDREVVLTVAAHASLPILGLDRSVYRDVRAIIIHPRTITRRGPRSTTMRGVVADGAMRVLGHAGDRRSPVVLSWNAVTADLRRPERGHNVVIHEFAHKIDAAAGFFDGTPEITDGSERAEWIRVCTVEYRRLRRQTEPDPVLRAYGGQNPSEFFAVASEAFFGRSAALREHKPDLYEVLSQYYRQDPASRGPAPGTDSVTPTRRPTVS